MIAIWGGISLHHNNNYLMNTILQGLPKIVCYLDDILVSGSTEEENLKNMEHVLLRLKHFGGKVKKEKFSLQHS